RSVGTRCWDTLEVNRHEVLGYIGNFIFWDITASNEELKEPIENQSLPADASPTALSLGYVVNSDLEEDEKDPKEDPAYYPADRGDNDDDKSSNDDDDDDDVEKDEEDKEEEDKDE
nr:hypothetical protein [Tanacetum cinerariifolium]